METLLSSRAAAIIALSVTFQRSAAETEMYAREALIRRLIDAGAPSPAMTAQAEFHGLRSGRPYVAAVLANREGAGRNDGVAIEEAAARAGLSGVWLAGANDGALSLVAELSAHTDDVKERFDTLVTQLSGPGTMFAAVSDVCHSVGELAAAHRDAKQVLQILRTFAVNADSPTILTAGELGAGCMLLAAADRGEAERLVRRALGPLANPDNPKALEVLQTLHAFVACSWGIRRAAEQLQVHENTIRYRLGRLAEETGRDVLTDPRAQLDAQIALLILRLQGRLESAG